MKGFSWRSEAAKSRSRSEILVSRSVSAMMLSRNFRRSRSVMSGVTASRSSRSSSAAPWIEVNGDFSSCDTWVAKVEMKLERLSSRRAMSRKLCDRAANSKVPWRRSGRSASGSPLPTRWVRANAMSQFDASLCWNRKDRVTRIFPQFQEKARLRSGFGPWLVRSPPVFDGRSTAPRGSPSASG